MRKLNIEKSFYRQFFSLFIILVLQNVVTISVNLADNMMLGRYSEISLSGVAAVNQIQFVYQQILMALGDGLVILGSQYWGKRQTNPMKRISASVLWIALFVGGLLFIVISIMPEKVVGLFTTDMAIIEQGVKYLSVIKYTYLFFALTQVLLATLRSVEIVRIAFILSVVAFVVNCSINWILIYGRYGAPELGVTGAAIGTLTARILELVILICYIVFKERKLQLKLKDYVHFDGQLTKDYIKLVTPIVFVQTLWGLNTALQTVILGHMTSEAIAANSVASTVFLVVKSMAVGSCATASVLIGKAIGMGDIKKVMDYSSAMQRMFVCIGVGCGLVLFLIRIPILSFYHLTPQTHAMANTFLMILSLTMIGMSYQMPTNNGIIRGGGNAMFVVKMDLISIWMIVLPLSFVMAFIVKASPAVVVFCLNLDQLFKCIPAYLESHYGNWIKRLTRD